MQKMRLHFLIFAFILFGCHETDNNYDLVDRLSGEAQLSLFHSFSIPERVRIYDKRYNSRLEPPDPYFEFGFDDRPTETIAYLIGKLQASGDELDFIRYSPIIFRLGTNNPNLICQPRFIGELRRLSLSYKDANRVRNVDDYVDFGKCKLPLT